MRRLEQGLSHSLSYFNFQLVSEDVEIWKIKVWPVGYFSRYRLGQKHGPNAKGRRLASGYGQFRGGENSQEGISGRVPDDEYFLCRNEVLVDWIYSSGYQCE